MWSRQVKTVKQNDLATTHSRAELDTHADTCCFGQNGTIVEETGHTVTVSPFTDGLGDLSDIKICTIAVAYDCPDTLMSYILLFYQSLYIPTLAHHLICPNQLRENLLTVNDTPLRYLPAAERTLDSHSIITTSPKLIIPLHCLGTISYFDTRRPTTYELFEDPSIPKLIMTSNHPWDPYSSHFSTFDLAITSHNYHQHYYPYDDEDIQYNSALRSISAVFVEDEFSLLLLDTIHVTAPGSRSIQALNSLHRKGKVTAPILAKRWRISIPAAQQTIDNSTQLAVREFHERVGQNAFAIITFSYATAD